MEIAMEMEAAEVPLMKCQFVVELYHANNIGHVTLHAIYLQPLSMGQLILTS